MFSDSQRTFTCDFVEALKNLRRLWLFLGSLRAFSSNFRENLGNLSARTLPSVRVVLSKHCYSRFEFFCNLNHSGTESINEGGLSKLRVSDSTAVVLKEAKKNTKKALKKI